MKNNLLSLIFLFSFPLGLFAGLEPVPATGARAISLGYAYVGVSGDFWSLFHNPAGIASVDRIGVGAYVERRFGLRELTHGSAGLVLPFSDQQAVGITAGSFGFDAYRESQIGAAYGIKLFDVVSLGAKINYGNININGFGSVSALFVDVGIQTQISPTISVGVSAINVNRAKIEGDILSETIPTVLTAGLAYQPTDKVLIVADVEKDVDHPSSFRFGAEYVISPHLQARAGMSTGALRWSAGLGIKVSDLQIDMAAAYHETLGFSPHVSLTYLFTRKQNKSS